MCGGYEETFENLSNPHDILIPTFGLFGFQLFSNYSWVEHWNGSVVELCLATMTQNERVRNNSDNEYTWQQQANLATNVSMIPQSEQFHTDDDLD